MIAPILYKLWTYYKVDATDDVSRRLVIYHWYLFWYLRQVNRKFKFISVVNNPWTCQATGLHGRRQICWCHQQCICKCAHLNFCKNWVACVRNIFHRLKWQTIVSTFENFNRIVKEMFLMQVVLQEDKRGCRRGSEYLLLLICMLFLIIGSSFLSSPVISIIIWAAWASWVFFPPLACHVGWGQHNTPPTSWFSVKLEQNKIMVSFFLHQPY